MEANLHARRFAKLISVEAIAYLRVFREFYGQVQIGAGLTLAEIEERWIAPPRIVAEWFSLFA